MTNSNGQSVLLCTVRKSGTGYEGTVCIPGLKSTKLVKRDSSSVYANRNGVISGAKALADRLNLTLEVSDTGSGSAKKSSLVPAMSDSF